MTLFTRLGGGRASGRELGGVVLGLAGVVVLNLGGELRASPTGAACAMLAPMGWALGSVASQRLPLPRGHDADRHADDRGRRGDGRGQRRPA